jgi:N-acyl homoserine lactone hydrolase
MGRGRVPVVRLFAFTCGWLTSAVSNFIEGESGEVRVPVPVFLVEHPKGKVLFDSGLHPDTQGNARARLGDFLAEIFHVEFREGEEVAARLRALEIDPGEISHLVSSHLHFDHAGGYGSIPNARLVVQAPEWAAGQDPDVAARNGFAAQDYDLGHARLEVSGEHDLFGDGRVVCVPTYGHTPGHQSLRVRLDSGDVVLTGDACYFRKTLETLRLPRFVYDRGMQVESLQRLRRLRDLGARIVFGHDPEQWANVPQAPQPWS